MEGVAYSNDQKPIQYSIQQIQEQPGGLEEVPDQKHGQTLDQGSAVRSCFKTDPDPAQHAGQKGIGHQIRMVMQDPLNDCDHEVSYALTFSFI